jgi:glycosyltransferase involved in cell wall biosynthesis
MRDQHLSEGFGGDRVVYLPPYVLGEKRNSTAVEASSVLDALPGRFILYFGRLGPEKGLKTLVEALSRCDGVPLVVCGEGPLRESLTADSARRLAGRVTFTGHLPKPVLDQVIERAVAVVMPSEWPENAPFTVLESMSLGVPVIVSNMGGLPEMAEMGGSVVYEAGDVGALASRIVELWSDPERARTIGSDGRRVIEETLTEERHLDGLEKIYNNAAGR